MTPDLQPLWQGDYTFGPSVLDEQLCEAEHIQGDAFQARAADASHSSLLRVSTVGGIAIAAFSALYFIAQLLRVFL